MDRRNFISTGLAAGTAAVTTLGAASAASAASAKSSGKFRLKYAPTFGAFRTLAGTKDPVDYIKFCADQGFRALFDNGMGRRPVEEQEKIAKEMERLGMALGPFGAGGASFVTKSKEVRDAVTRSMKNAVEVAKRVNGKWTLVVPGSFDQGLEWDYQTANAIENCKYCCDALEESGLVMVLEPLNSWKNHPGRFLTRIPQAYQICQAVDHPCCKIVNDLYHQQIQEGNLIPNIDMAWEHIASFHLGDNPGRKEPTTGEINYKNIFKHLHGKGYDGVLCMEHGQSKKGAEGEQAVIDAYRECDAF